MQQEIQRAAEQFSTLKEELYAKHASARDEATALGNSIVDPTKADAETVWSVLWPKPLYSGKQVEVAKGWYEQLRPNMAGTWKRMRYDHGPYAIRRNVALCSSGKMNVSSFLPVGPDITALKLTVNAPPQSYYAMVGAGMALTELAERNDHPFGQLPTEVTADTIKALQTGFGYGWGHITVMHFLTDLGLCCKPDIHLLNTMRALGLYGRAPDKKTTLPQAFEVYRLVKEILIELEGEVTPRGLRELDKNLMDISHYKLVQPVPGKARRLKPAQTGTKKFSH